MSLFNWGNESPEQRAIRARLEQEALYEQAVRMANARNSAQFGGAGGGGAVVPDSVVESINQSTLVVFHEYDQPTYRYYVADYSSNSILGPFDTGVSVEDYDLGDLNSYPLQYSGYGLRFYRGDINEHTMLFLDYRGTIVESIVAISTDVAMDSYQGKYIAATDFDEQLLWIFDGTTVLTDTTVFQGAAGFDLGTNIGGQTYSSTNTGLGLRVLMSDDSRRFYLCNSSEITQVYETTPEEALIQSVEFHPFYDSDKFVIITRNVSDYRVDKLEIISSTGTVEHTISIDTELLTNSNFQIYGSNKFFIHLNNSLDTSVPHVIHSYDGSNNLIRSTVLDAVVYTNWRSEYRRREFNNDYNYPIVEHAIMWFHGSSTTNNELTYFNRGVLLRMFEGQDHSLYTYADGTTRGVYLSDEGINNTFALYVTDRDNDGDLQAMVIKATGSPVFSDLGYSTDGLDDIDVTENGERMAVVIEYLEGPGDPINTIVQSFNSSGIKAEPKLELETESHGTEAGYGTYLVTGDNLTNFLTPSGAWAQYPDFENSTGAYFHTNLDQTTAPYVATWLDPKVKYTHTQLDDDPDEGVAPEGFIMDGSIVNGEEYFGTGSTYFTNLYPGLFVLSAKSINISSFGIDGNSGADGNGEVETEIVNINSYSKTYTAYVKKVYDSGDPSINQIIIIDTDGTGVSQSVDLTTEDDTHRLTGIDAATEIHYLLFAKTEDGIGYVTPEEIESVITEYLDLVDDQTLGDTLSVLNSSYSNITGVFPAYDSEDPDRIYYFSDAPDANSTIDDGGGDMYDTANIISTNLTGGRAIKIFKSTGEVTQVTLLERPEMYFGRNGFFTIDVNNNSDLIIRTYDLDGNLITTSNSTHIDYEYGGYIEDRGGLITDEKYFDPELGEFGTTLWNSRFYMISYDMMEFVSVTLVDSSNRVKVISNDWGEWNGPN
jgi:hypothetical protein